MIDTHSHLYSTEFHADLVEIIGRAKSAGVEKVYLPAIDSTTHEAMMLLAKQQPSYCIPMMGLHPCYVDEGYEKELELVEEWLAKENFVAIGEIGLDYYHSTEFKEQQIDALERQIRMAMERELPIVIHTRSSMDDCIKVIEEVGGGNVKGIFHCLAAMKGRQERL